MKSTAKPITIGLYFEIKDAVIYGGAGSFGHANTSIECNADDLTEGQLKKYIEAQITGMARMCKVPEENVKLISRAEYEDYTGED